MNEEAFNMSMRIFLKKVGITSQRKIEKAVIQANESGKIQGYGSLNASVVLEIDDIDLRVEIQGEIPLE